MMSFISSLGDESLVLPLLSGVALGTAILVALKWPFYTYLAFVISLPFGGYALSKAVVSVSIPNLLLLAITVALLIRLFLNREGLRMPRIALVPLALMALMLIASISTLFLDHSGWRDVITRSGVILAFAVTTILVKDLRDLRKVLLTLTVGISLASLLTILHSLGIIEFGDTIRRTREFGSYVLPFRRTLGIDLSYGGYGMLVMSVLPFCALAFFTTKHGLFRKRLIAASTGLVILLSVFISQSRSTWLAVGIALLLLFFIVNVAVYRRVWQTAMLALVVSTLLFTIGYDLVSYSVQEVADMGYKNITKRLSMIEYAYDRFSQNPLLGVGHSVKWGDTSIHNNLAYNLASTGLLGFIPYILILLWTYIVLNVILRHSLVKKKVFAIGLLIGLVGMMIELNAYTGYAVDVFWIQLGLPYSLIANVKMNGTSEAYM